MERNPGNLLKFTGVLYETGVINKYLLLTADDYEWLGPSDKNGDLLFLLWVTKFSSCGKVKQFEFTVMIINFLPNWIGLFYRTWCLLPCLARWIAKFAEFVLGYRKETHIETRGNAWTHQESRLTRDLSSSFHWRLFLKLFMARSGDTVLWYRKRRRERAFSENAPTTAFGIVFKRRENCLPLQ